MTKLNWDEAAFGPIDDYFPKEAAEKAAASIHA